MPSAIQKKAREKKLNTTPPAPQNHNQKFKMEIRHLLTVQGHIFLGKGTSWNHFCIDAAKLYHRSLPSLQTILTHYCGNLVLCRTMAENNPWQIHSCTINLLPNLSLGGLSLTLGAHHSQVTPQGCLGQRDLSCHMCRALSHPLFHSNICCRNVTIHNIHLAWMVQKEEKPWILACISFFKNHTYRTLNWIVPLGGNISRQKFMRVIYFCHLDSRLRNIW